MKQELGELAEAETEFARHAQQVEADIVLRSREIKQAHEQLAQSQLLLQIAGRAAKLGGWTITLPDKTLTWSDQACIIHDLQPGHTPTIEEGIGYFVAEHRPTIRRLIHECETLGTPYDAELEKTTAKGRRISVRTIGEAVRDDNGNIVRLQGAFQDITAQKAAESSLAESQQRFRQLADAMPFIVWTAGADGNIDFSNTEFFEFTGVSPDAPADERWQPCLHLDDIDRCLTEWTRCVDSHEPFDIEYRMLRGSDGEFRWFRVQARPIRDASGMLTSWYGTAIDIHETKLLEQSATKYASRLTTTLESITDGLFIVDLEWQFTYVNPEAERLLMRTSADLLGKSMWDEFADAVDTVAWANYRRAVEENTTVAFEFYFAPLEKWFDVKAYPSEEGLAVYFRDITALHEHHEKLRESDERFRLLAKATNDAIWDWNLTDDSRWWNDGLDVLFGATEGETGFTIESWTKRIHSDDREKVVADLNAAIANGTDGWSAEYRFERLDGTFASVLDRGYVIHDADGVPVRMIGGMTDLTEQKNLEAQLLQSQKMEAIGQLAGGIAHDFNNLLTVINGYSDLLLRSIEPDSPHEKRIAAIRDAGDRAANLTRQMLAFSRKQILAPKVIDVNEIVDGMNKLLRRIIGEDINFTAVLDPALLPVKVDPP
ncbi:MAG: PAS domain-containing protein, partial [Blastocatellia bacterium]|nr:PAS domain-containing protein [Blastocatellia bacterium]